MQRMTSDSNNTSKTSETFKDEYVESDGDLVSVAGSGSEEDEDDVSNSMLDLNSDNKSHSDDGETSGETKSDDELTTMDETQGVVQSKRCVIVLLIICAIVAAGLTYHFARQGEKEAFETQFETNVYEIQETVVHRWETAQIAVANLATSVASAAVAASQAQGMDTPDSVLPTFRMPLFETHAQEVMDLSTDALAVGWAPLTPHQQDSSSNMVTLPIQQLVQVDTNASFPPQGIRYNLLAEPTMEDLFLEMLVTKQPTQSGLAPLNFLYLPPGLPHTMMMQPIFNDTVRTTTSTSASTSRSAPTTSATTTDSHIMITGTTFTVLSWNAMFHNILATDSGKMIVVLEDSCDDIQLLYELDGRTSTFLGYGGEDQKHTTSSDICTDMERIISLDSLLMTSQEASSLDDQPQEPSTTSTTSKTCDYHLHLFPSQQLKQEQTSYLPVLYALLVLGGVGLFLIAFVAYDRFVQARQEKVLSRAARSNAIVASLFPANVRDRILKDAEGKEDAMKKRRDSKHGTSVATKVQLKSFLLDGGVDENGEPVSNDADSKPIADLFPHTTVLFGDIAGFTAWSSIREPCQVFQLLETLYNAFDHIAKRRRVFKVETIGDCYVAVCGLPEPRKDHAPTMARFARDLLSTMNTLTSRLEITLGPDTGDLAMRIGLHSGPVTAGVLRGQNCRFQLFGDTVNTAARMESNGLRDAIHISEETANLIREAGKEHWLVPRADKIVAKGKGEMTTYFLKSKKAGSPGSVTSGSDRDSCAGGSQEEASLSTSGAAHLPKRIQRLVKFNAELLERLLRSVIARRDAEALVRKPNHTLVKFSVPGDGKSTDFKIDGSTVIDEVQDILTIGKFNAKAAMKQQNPSDIVLDANVVKQLHEYVTVLATMYRKEVPFHNFEHASHVTMSVSKLLSRIVAPDSVLSEKEENLQDEVVKKLHEHTYGITSDPMTQFTAVVAALIHDVDHTGVPNAQLIKEGSRLAEIYRNKSVAEQNSVDLAWDLLMDEGFKDLRAVIYTNETEQKHFRSLLVNLVMATDISDKELGAKRKERWAKAFAASPGEKLDESHQDSVNRKATIVLEHLIQASDVAHTMQHWHIYRKWNEKFFEENMKAFSDGRAEKDPSTYWYQGELGFFDFYIIPLAKKLKECGVFGVASDEYLIYAEKNRKEWEQRGEEAVAEMAAKYLPSLNEDEEELSDHEYDDTDDNTSSFDANSALVLDSDTIQNVSESWELLRRIPDYEEKAGTILFSVLFAKSPPSKVLFGFPLDMDPQSPTLLKSRRFLMHSKYMIQMLDKALQLLGPDSELLAEILSDLGKKHVRLGVKESFFPIMGEALMEALNQLLGDKLTEDMEISWGIVYEALSTEMIKAMNNDKAVIVSWNRLKQITNYQEVAGVILFQKLFQDCPDAKILFGFPADMDPYCESMTSSRRFKSHAAYFIEMLDKALDMVEAKQIGLHMKRLGEMHAAFGVQDQYFPFMGEALFHTLQITLKKSWNAHTEEAWRDVYGRLASQMIAAMKEAQK